jgi:LmbE family N-acetylglucosaminyl deacetylase
MLGWLPECKRDGRPLKVLCLGAHSDDIEIGCGGSVMKLISAGPVDVRWVVFSGGRTRALEAAESAAHVLQTVEKPIVELHEFRDGFFPDQWAQIKEAFERLKSEYDPDLIFTHYSKDMHQDHRVICELTWNTFRNHMILEYEIPKYEGDLGNPGFYIPLSQEIADLKTKVLMDYFESQSNRHWFSEELFYGLMRIRGMECCSHSGYAEGFHVRKIRMG